MSLQQPVFSLYSCPLWRWQEYGQFPSKFCALAQRVPEARLYDNSGKDLKLVAAWQAANPYPEIEDIKTYQAFTALGGIDVSQTTPCFAMLESAGLKNDLAHCTFGIRGKIVPEQKIFARPTRPPKPSA